MKTILVIGAGKFGKHLAIDLCEMGNEVMLVDQDEKTINEISHLVTASEIGDFTSKSNLESLGIDDFDYIFVCVGDFQNSVIMVDYLKDLGAKYVVGKATSKVHEKFLLKNGADAIIYPERDAAYANAVEYSNQHVYNYKRLSDDAGIYEIEAPSKWCGKNLVELNVRKMHNVTVIASKNKDNEVKAIKSADYVFTPDEHIIVMGSDEDIRKITK